MADQKIVLYDIPSSGPNRSWSLNVWKARLVLNYKKIPYETRWLPLGRVGETIKALGVEPNAPGTAFKSYTVPTICLPDGKTYIMNSLLITPKLDELYPEPSLQLGTKEQDEVQEVVDSIVKPLIPYWLPKVARNVLNDEDKAWMYEVRAPEAKVPLEEWERMPADEIWANAKPSIEKLVALLERHNGPFVMGEKPSYGDFVIVAFLKMFERMGNEDLGRFIEFPSIKALWDASAQWVQRDD